MDGAKFVKDTNAANINEQGDRNYIAGEVTMQLRSSIGTTALNAEF